MGLLSNAFRKFALGLLLGALSASPQAWATDAEIGEVVVSARQVEEPLHTTAHSVSIVTGEELDRRVDRSVAEGLEELPGLFVQELGTRGESVNVRIRGATAADTLVLIDGVRLNNPANNEANLGLIPVEQIERIEVLRGSQAVLYGGNAVGGVVNIITKSGESPSQTRLSLEGGNLGHQREWLGTEADQGLVKWNLGVSRTDENGQFKNDGFGESAITQRWDLKPTETLRLILGSRILLSEKKLARDFLVGPAGLYDPSLPPDAAFIQIAPDANREFDRLLTTQSLQLRQDWSPIFRTELLYGFYLSDETENNSNRGDAAFVTPSGLELAPSSVRNKIKASRQSVDLRQFFFIPDLGHVQQTVTAGFEFYDERVKMSGEVFPGDPASSATTIGPFIPPLSPFPPPGVSGARQNYAPYVQYHLGFAERLFVDAGLRYDRNSAYGGEASPRAAIAVMIPEIDGKFHGAYGEGFLPPTQVQLFNPVTGNPNLMPQKSQSYEAGYEQRFGEKAGLFATFFYLDFDNLIDRVGTNINDAFSVGLESGFWWKIIPQLKIGANYTFTHSVDESGGGGSLPEVPPHVFNAYLSAKPMPRMTLDSTLTVVSAQRESFPLVSVDGVFIGGTPAASLFGGNNSGYANWDLAVSYEFPLESPGHPQSVTVFGKAANILDDHYETFFGFPNPGFHFIAGANLLF